jgi:hypothetical protein
MQQAGRLIVRVVVPEGDEDEIDAMTRQLMAEIRDSSSVDAAELASSPGTVPGAKSGELVQIGQLVLTVVPAAIPGLVAMLRAWSSRPRAAPVKVALKLEHGEVDVEYPVGSMSHDDLMELVAAARGSASSPAAGGSVEEP